MNSTDTLVHIVDTLCKDDKEVQAIYKALDLALNRYQWQYQNADKRQFRDVNSSISRAVAITIKHLENSGFEQLAEDVYTALEGGRDLLTKNKFLSAAKKIMKNSLIQTVEKSRYNEIFAKSMEKAFIEYCEEYPLKYAPVDIEGEFEDSRKKAEYEDLQEYNPYK